jgi:hypothetical protein
MLHAPPASGVVAGDADFAPNLMGDAAPRGGATCGAVGGANASQLQPCRLRSAAPSPMAGYSPPRSAMDIPEGRSAIAEVYPSLWSRSFANEGRTLDQHDAFSISAWLSQADRDGGSHRCRITIGRASVLIFRRKSLRYLRAVGEPVPSGSPGGYAGGFHRESPCTLRRHDPFSFLLASLCDADKCDAALVRLRLQSREKDRTLCWIIVQFVTLEPARSCKSDPKART